jgi:hypothetical protein
MQAYSIFAANTNSVVNEERFVSEKLIQITRVGKMSCSWRATDMNEETLVIHSCIFIIEGKELGMLGRYEVTNVDYSSGLFGRRERCLGSTNAERPYLRKIELTDNHFIQISESPAEIINKLNARFKALELNCSQVRKSLEDKMRANIPVQEPNSWSNQQQWSKL